MDKKTVYVLIENTFEKYSNNGRILGIYENKKVAEDEKQRLEKIYKNKTKNRAIDYDFFVMELPLNSRLRTAWVYNFYK